MSAQQLVLASGNPGKLRELTALLAPLQFDLTTQASLGVESPEETGATFLENALIKARHAALLTSLPAIADDSGIEVDALGGAPGVRSARFAGPGAGDRQNRQKLLQALQGVPFERRGARYRCVIVLVHSASDSEPIVADGTWAGRIAEGERGSGGFGYDPIFVPAQSERTAAQLEPSEKNAVSHRAAALRGLLSQLRERAG